MSNCETHFQLVLFKNKATKAQQKRCINSINKQNYKKCSYMVVAEDASWDKIKAQLTGDFVMFLNMTDYLSENALASFAQKVAENEDAQWIYADEDVWEAKKKVSIHLKPQWSKETFLSFFYTGVAAVYRKDLCLQSNMQDVMLGNWQNYDFALRFLQVCEEDRIYHIPQVLCHVEKSKAEEHDKQNLAEIKRDYLSRNKVDGYLEEVEGTGHFRMVYRAEGMVSIVIPSKDNVKVLETGLYSIFENTSYKNYEIIVVDNGSSTEHRQYLEKLLSSKNITYLYEPMEFNFSRMCNIGAAKAKGDYILFLNDDIECQDPRWLERMVGQAAQDGIGAVGAKLLYPTDNKIQHVGVVNIGSQIGPAHILTKIKDEGVIANGRNCLDYNYDAVTAACLLIKKDVFIEVGGFFESLPVSYNDVDLCYRLREAGYRNVVRTDAVLIHHESISRGLDSRDDEKMKRLRKEREVLYKRHPWIVENTDRSYHPKLTLENTDFSTNERDVPSEHNAPIKGKIYTNKAFNVIIDRITKEHGLNIGGWFYFKKDEMTNKTPVYLVFENADTKKQLWYSAYKTVRPDVAEVMKHKADYCGFVCRVSEEEIKKLSGCRIGVCIKVYGLVYVMTWTETVLD